MKEKFLPEASPSLDAQAESLARQTLDQLWQLIHSPLIVRRSAYGTARKTDAPRENNWPPEYQKILQKKIHRLLRDPRPYSDIQEVRDNPLSIALALYRHLGTQKAKLKWYNFLAKDELERWLKSSDRLDALLVRELREAYNAKEEIVGKLYSTHDGAWDVCVLLYPRSIESDGKRLGLCIESLKTGSRGEPYLELTRPLKEGEARRRLVILSLRAARDVMIHGETVRKGESVLAMSYDPDARSILEVEGAGRIEKTPEGRRKVRTFLRREDPWFPAFLEFVNAMRGNEHMPIRHVLSESSIPSPGMLLLDTGEEVPLESVYPPTPDNQEVSARIIAGGYMTPHIGTRYPPNEFAKIAALFPLTLTFAASEITSGEEWKGYRDALVEVKGSILDYGAFPAYKNLRSVLGVIRAPEAKTVDAPMLSYLGLGLIAEDATSISLPSLPETARIFMGKDSKFNGPMRAQYPQRIFQSE